MRDMVRDLTPSGINKAVDEATLESLERYRNASPEEIEARIKELEGSWDLECYVELGSALLTIGGLALAYRTRKMLFLPLAVQGLVLAHSLPFFDPLTPMLRTFGIWTRQEIEREKQALKLMRGDFSRVEQDDTPKNALAAAQGARGLKESTREGANTSRRTAKPRGRADKSSDKSSERSSERSMEIDDEARRTQVMGEDLRPSDAPTVSGPSGDIHRGPSSVGGPPADSSVH